MPLRPSGLQPETPVWIGDVVRGDHFFFTMRVPLVLIPSVYKAAGIKVTRWVVDSQRVTKRGVWSTTGNGIVGDNDTVNEIIYVNIAGRHNYAAGDMFPAGVAEIPWGYIQQATLERVRIEGTAPNQTINSRFPRIIPVSFVQ